ncbi:MAG: pilin [Patescibacteria group bacterium]|nr:pilin [Patescibacteria group bacterium]
MLKKLFWLFLFFILKAQNSFAQGGGQPGGPADSGSETVELHNPLGGRTFSTILKDTISYLIKVSAPIVIIMFLIGGFQMLTAGDNENKFKQGKKTITYAAIGTLVILISSGFIYVLADILGIDKSKIEQTLP